ncbi:MAG: apolipoprotein N-acyltransferase [Bowdeniella nasicola]|nr:apolipoprotein N-acyltransferase [Bowdeniella nasicola]
MHISLLRLLTAAVAGAALNLAFAPFTAWYVAPLTLAVLALTTRRASIGGAFSAGLIFGLGFFLPLLWWSTISVGAFVPWIALSVLQALYVAFFTAIRQATLRARWAERFCAPLIDGLGSAALWVALEALRARWPFGGFAWGLLGYSQVDGPLGRLAAYGSTTLVGGAVVLVAILLARVIHAPQRGAGRYLARSLALVTALALPVAAGLVPLDTRPEAGSLRVGIVQGNVPRPPLPDWRDQARAVTNNHREGTHRLIAAEGPVDLVVWPESSADIDPRTDPGVAAMVEDAVATAGVPLMVGSQEFREHTRTNEHLIYVPTDEGATLIDFYRKQHPVPFGEYVPYRDFFRRLSTQVDRITHDMVAGDEPGLVHIPWEGRDLPLGDVICFEIAFEDLVRESVSLGAQALIVPINNASFGTSFESAQQTQIARFRAVEHGRAVAQASTMGISALIDPRGRVLSHTGLWESAHLVADLPLRTSLTVADRLGAAPPIAAALSALVWIGMSLAQGGRRADARDHSDV